jgi:hypothetical protein
MNKDKIIALVFFALTIAFIIISMFNEAFFAWIFKRHHNLWSWYIRPLFLIPFCYFAFHRSLAGISITIFCLFTSMFWFSPPEVVPEQVNGFLQFEKDWLYGEWDYKKVLLIATVPISFLALGLAFWKRSLLIGISVVVLMAIGKLVWSIYNAGDAGKSIVMPAVAGLIFCIFFILGFKRLRKQERQR